MNSTDRNKHLVEIDGTNAVVSLARQTGQGTGKDIFVVGSATKRVHPVAGNDAVADSHLLDRMGVADGGDNPSGQVGLVQVIGSRNTGHGIVDDGTASQYHETIRHVNPATTPIAHAIEETGAVHSDLVGGDRAVQQGKRLALPIPPPSE